MKLEGMEFSCWDRDPMTKKLYRMCPIRIIGRKFFNKDLNDVVSDSTFWSIIEDELWFERMKL